MGGVGGHLVLADDPRVDGGDEDDPGDHGQQGGPHVVPDGAPPHLHTVCTDRTLTKIERLPISVFVLVLV